MAITESSGREPWIFRVDHPDELIADHRGLIASALYPDEPILHLIYSPAWEGHEAPFGITGHSASHAIAVTPTRWIISENRHASWIRPKVHPIPFSDILLIEKGTALLQGWLVIRYAAEGALNRVTILHKAIGNHHFDNAIRMYRRLAAANKPFPLHATGESDAWQHVPSYLAQEVMPILNDGERVFCSTRTMEQWREGHRRWKRFEECVAPWSAVLTTDEGIVYVEAERPHQRGLWAFGTNVWCIPPGAVRTSAIEERDDQLPCVRLVLTRSSVRNDLCVTIPSSDDAIIPALGTGFVTKSAGGDANG